MCYALNMLGFGLRKRPMHRKVLFMKACTKACTCLKRPCMNLEKINLHFQTHLFSKDVETEQVGEVVNMITMMVFQEQTEGATKQTIDGWFAH